jgi:hypothetical protein
MAVFQPARELPSLGSSGFLEVGNKAPRIRLRGTSVDSHAQQWLHAGSMAESQVKEKGSPDPRFLV